MDETTKNIFSHLLYASHKNIICRLCLSDLNEFINLNDLVGVKSSSGTEYYYLPLHNIMADIFGQLNFDDGLPMTICNKCTETLINCYELKSTYNDNLHLWEDALTQLEKLPLAPVEAGTVYLYAQHGSYIVNDKAKIPNDDVVAAAKKANKLKNHCQICNKGFRTKNTLYKHIVAKHILKNSYSDYSFEAEEKVRNQMGICDDIDISDLAIKAIRKRVPRNKKSKSSFICDCCGKEFKSRSNMQRHREQYSKSCPNCRRTYKSSAAYLIHEKLCTSTEPYQPFRPKKKLNYERVARAFVCDYCGSKCLTKASLVCHIKTLHLNPKSEQCKMCGKRFNTKGQLQGHFVVHTGARNEKCDICESFFVTKAALIYHKRLHTGEKPYSCDKCDEKFINSSRRADHMRRKHQERSLLCNICCASFYSSSSLKRHVKKHYQPSSKLYNDKLNNVVYEVPVIKEVT